MGRAALELLNSDWRDWRGSGRREDRLQDDRWLEAFLERWGFAAAGPPGPEARDRLSSLRSLLRRLAETVADGRNLSADDLQALDAVLAGGAASRRLVRPLGRLELAWVPRDPGWDWVLAELAVSFAELLVGDPGRIKFCENADCRWLFYDESRNRGRRWCEDTCASLVRVRRFRARKRATGRTPPE